MVRIWHKKCSRSLLLLQFQGWWLLRSRHRRGKLLGNVRWWECRLCGFGPSWPLQKQTRIFRWFVSWGILPHDPSHSSAVFTINLSEIKIENGETKLWNRNVALDNKREEKRTEWEFLRETARPAMPNPSARWLKQRRTRSDEEVLRSQCH